MVSIVIPCYRSETTLAPVVEEIIGVMENREYEIVLVCDGSPDNVWEVIKRLAEKYPKLIKGVLFSKNFGQHSALMAGYRKVSGDVIVSMDDDGQSDPKGIPKLLEKLEEGYDVVYARYPKLKESLLRRMGSWLDSKMSETLIGKPKHVKGTSFNAIRRFVIDEMVRYENSYPYVGGLVYRTTKNIGEVPIEHKDRTDGTSGYSLMKLIRLWMNGFTAFSEKPLRAATFLGIGCAMIGFLYGIIIVIQKFVNPAVQLGYSSLMAVILFIGGMLMLLLGIIGEYIGRIYITINNAPQYVIKEEVDNISEK